MGENGVWFVSYRCAVEKAPTASFPPRGPLDSQQDEDARERVAMDKSSILLDSDTQGCQQLDLTHKDELFVLMGNNLT